MASVWIAFQELFIIPPLTLGKIEQSKTLPTVGKSNN
jgi:hypothetical protein